MDCLVPPLLQYSNTPIFGHLILMDPIKLTIDGKEVATTKGKTVIEVAAEIGIAIPHYCYHPKLPVAGTPMAGCSGFV